MSDDGYRDYQVECTGTVREVYLARARTEAEAMEQWEEGACVVQESGSVEPVSAREVKE